MSDCNLAEVARRASLGLPPMPTNNNHRRDDAHMERVATVPVCGIAALFAFGVVCGIPVGWIVKAITNL